MNKLTFILRESKPFNQLAQPDHCLHQLLAAVKSNVMKLRPEGYTYIRYLFFIDNFLEISPCVGVYTYLFNDCMDVLLN